MAYGGVSGVNETSVTSTTSSASINQRKRRKARKNGGACTRRWRQAAAASGISPRAAYISAIAAHKQHRGSLHANAQRHDSVNKRSSAGEISTRRLAETWPWQQRISVAQAPQTAREKKPDNGDNVKHQHDAKNKVARQRRKQ